MWGLTYSNEKMDIKWVQDSDVFQKDVFYRNYQPLGSLEKKIKQVVFPVVFRQRVIGLAHKSIV